MDKTQIPALFGNAVFGDREMRRRLPKELYRRLHGCIETGAELDAELAGAVACGWHGIVFHDGDAEEMERKLKELGVKY